MAYNFLTKPVFDDSLATVIQTGSGAVARSMRTHANDYVYAADYGVVANGNTDDTAAWGNVFTAAAASGIRTIIAPPGVSIVSTITQPLGTTIIGVKNNGYFNASVTPSNGSFIKSTTSTTCVVLTTTAYASNEWQGTGMIDMGIIGTGSMMGVTLANGIPFWFRGCTFIGCNAAVEGNTTNTGGGYATAYIDNCMFAYNAIGVWNMTDGRVTNSTLNGNGVGIQMDTGGNANTFANNKIEFNTSRGIQSESSELNLIHGNNFDSNGPYSVYYTGCNSGAISGNVFTNQTFNTMTAHMYISGNTSLSITGNSTEMSSGGTTPTETRSLVDRTRVSS